MRTFRISERSLGGECREIRLEGELDLAVADRLHARLKAVAMDDVEALICLKDCDFIDSSGIAVIVLAHRLMAGRGRRLFVCHPSPDAGRILAMTGLTEEGIVVDGADGTHTALADHFGHVVNRPFRAEESLPGRSSSAADLRPG
jgi:stage II sporulation protein AA (anti-sigma F factor antagonist)